MQSTISELNVSEWIREFNGFCFSKDYKILLDAINHKNRTEYSGFVKDGVEYKNEKITTKILLKWEDALLMKIEIGNIQWN